MDRALRFTFVRQRVTKEGHDAIAEALVYIALVPGDAHRASIFIATDDLLQDFQVDA